MGGGHLTALLVERHQTLARGSMCVRAVAVSADSVGAHVAIHDRTERERERERDAFFPVLIRTTRLTGCWRDGFTAGSAPGP